MIPRSTIAWLMALSVTTATAESTSPRFGIENGVRLRYYVPQTLVAQKAESEPYEVVVIYSYHDGYAQGQGAASTCGNSGAFVGGMAWGLGLGLIGTGIGYFTTGSAEPPNSDRVMRKGEDFRQGYIDGYRQTSRSRARTAKLGGGIIGTLAFVAVVFGG